MSKEEKAKEEKPYLQDLFDHMSNEHGLTLLQSQMQEIIDICMEQTDYNPLSSQLTACKEALREFVDIYKDVDVLTLNVSEEEALTKAKTLIE